MVVTPSAQGMSGDAAGSEALRMQQRLSEDSARLLGGRPSLEDGSSSFAAIFGATADNSSANFSTIARRDSQSSLVSSRLDDLGFNLDLPGLQVSWQGLHLSTSHHMSESCLRHDEIGSRYQRDQEWTGI